jgi:hypothetical protein
MRNPIRRAGCKTPEVQDVPHRLPPRALLPPGCARPRAQRGLQAAWSRNFPVCWTSRSLLRPRTGAPQPSRPRWHPRTRPQPLPNSVLDENPRPGFHNLMPGKTFREWAVDKWREGIASLLVAAAIALLAKFGDKVFDSVTSALGKKLLLELLFVLFVSCAWLGWLVYRHRKEEPEAVRVCSGVEFRRSKTTGWQWCPFCPKCHTIIHPQPYEHPGFGCSAGCGWRSPISADEIWKIIADAD